MNSKKAKFFCLIFFYLIASLVTAIPSEKKPFYFFFNKSKWKRTKKKKFIKKKIKRKKKIPLKCEFDKVNLYLIRGHNRTVLNRYFCINNYLYERYCAHSGYNSRSEFCSYGCNQELRECNPPPEMREEGAGLCSDGVDNDTNGLTDCEELHCQEFEVCNPNLGDDPANLDTDNDGILDRQDNCYEVPNPGQENQDEDYHGDVCDLCPLIPGVQGDNDQDGVGNDCDDDDDNDGVNDLEDNCPNVMNPEQEDADNDLIGNICDPHPNPVVNNGVPYFDELIPSNQRQNISHKYRAMFSNDHFLDSIAFDNTENQNFHRWPEEKKVQLLQTIIFYENNNGTSVPQYEGNCNLNHREDNPCYVVDTTPKPNVSFRNNDYRKYIHINHIAWNLYVEANRLTPWSLLSYSKESLDILFNRASTQPRLGKQYYVLNWDIIENYKIVKGLLRENGDSNLDLVAENSLQTLLNITRFVGERVKHIKGTSRNSAGPHFSIWPFRERDMQGNPLLDDEGVGIPLHRIPTPKEILIYRNPHKDLRRNANALWGPLYHIVNGCWGTSKLLKSLLASINLPVKMNGDYVNFSGHSGAKFLEINETEYQLHHSDDLYYYEWTYGLLNINQQVSGEEIWGLDGFNPFAEFIPGYSVLHSNLPRISYNFQELSDNQNFSEEQRDTFSAKFPFHSGLYTLSHRVLSLRAISNPPSVQNLYSRCNIDNYVERRHIPMSLLTEFEIREYRRRLDVAIQTRKDRMGQNLSCLDLYLEELNDLYSKKTGLNLLDDEDQDGIENHRDCNVYRADEAPCEEAFRNAIEIRTNG